MASSINIPIPKVKAIRVRRFKSYPKTSIIKNVPNMLVGIAKADIAVALKLPKNKNTISVVKTTPKIISNLT